MNLFSRAKPIATVDDWQENKPVLEDIAKLNSLLEKEIYSESDKQEIISILIRNNLATRSGKDDLFRINQIREKLYTNPDEGVINIKANGRSKWLGWVEPVREVLTTAAIRNTARVIGAVNADVLCLVEVEDRFTLEKFSQDILVKEEFLPVGQSYPNNMLIDGNDDRGIDVGIYSRYKINMMISHIKDTYTSDGQEYPIFSRDCAEYEVEIPSAQPLWVLVNHLKSKGFGSQADSNKKRGRQANQIKEILNRYDLQNQFVVVAGDFNDTPNSPYLAPLLNLPDLHDVMTKLPPNERWTYKGGSQQIDYLLVSTPLWNRLSGVGVERRGIYRHAAIGDPSKMFAEVKDLKSQASDHAAVWADLQF
jgi:endonuclease/exonuclease/phosphatase family metal-dependent hydrolase